MQAAYDLLWGSPGVANTIRQEGSGCEKMTNADLISIAGYIAVVQAGGVAKGGCGWYPGRYMLCMHCSSVHMHECIEQCKLDVHDALVVNCQFFHESSIGVCMQVLCVCLCSYYCA
jgi:hypothetical protein